MIEVVHPAIMLRNFLIKKWESHFEFLMGGSPESHFRVSYFMFFGPSPKDAAHRKT